jgi:hypothetical protein
MKYATPGETARSREDDLRRVQLDLPPKAFERLQSLKADTEASTYAEVLKNALKLYAAAVEYRKEGRKFMIQDKDGTIFPLLIFP